MKNTFKNAHSQIFKYAELTSANRHTAYLVRKETNEMPKAGPNTLSSCAAVEIEVSVFDKESTR